MTEGFDNALRLQLYRDFVQSGAPPSTERLAQLMKARVEDVRAAMERLAAGKVIVLQPESREILMANPLSAVPTAYRVSTRDRSFFRSCIWDALGIASMLRPDAAVDTSCACCGEAMTLQVQSEQVAFEQGVVHFAIPAKRWWENIVFT